jgi:hypothetical protein
MAATSKKFKSPFKLAPDGVLEEMQARPRLQMARWRFVSKFSLNQLLIHQQNTQ